MTRPSAKEVALAHEALLLLAHYPAPRGDEIAQAADETVRREAEAVLRRAAFRVVGGAG